MMWDSNTPQTVSDYGFTWAYAAPEVQELRLRYPRAMDIWSFGVILWEVVTGTRPFASNGNEPLPTRIEPKKEVGTIPDELDSLIFDCLRRSPKDRPTANECVSRVENLTI